jgi:hypothetical protein
MSTRSIPFFMMTCPGSGDEVNGFLWTMSQAPA